jgi:hypothetical protein
MARIASSCAVGRRERTATADGVDLYWIPLGAGAGGAVVRWSGRVYEAAAAARARRTRDRLFHSALEVIVSGRRTTIEMAPVWSMTGARGVVAEGPVGRRFLGRWRLFRYEVRCWHDGFIPDAAAALDGPVRVSDQPDVARTVLDLVPEFPTHTWGRDELHTGDMWNSNSLVAWLLARAGLPMDDLLPPPGGRAPGWDAGLAAASGWAHAVGALRPHRPRGRRRRAPTPSRLRPIGRSGAGGPVGDAAEGEREPLGAELDAAAAVGSHDVQVMAGDQEVAAVW